MIKKLLFIAFMSYGLAGISQNLELLYNGGSVGDTLSVEVPNLLLRNDIYIDIVNHSHDRFQLKLEKQNFLLFRAVKIVFALVNFVMTQMNPLLLLPSMN